MVKETEYQKKLAAERTRLAQENNDKRAAFEQATKANPTHDLKPPIQPEPPKSDQDVKWQAFVNVQNEKMKEQEQEDFRKSQLTVKQRQQEDERERAEMQARLDDDNRR